MPILVYPNQKIITIKKEKCDRDNLYAMINIDAMEKAAIDLCGRTANAFILWCYFARNQNNYQLALSNKAVSAAMGLSKDAYDNAVSLLIDRGYLVRVKDNMYDFYEVPIIGEEKKVQ